MKTKFKFHLVLVFVMFGKTLFAQIPDFIYTPNIASAKLYQHGNQLAYPVIQLNSAGALELEFDDLDGDVKNYSYTYQICDVNWHPVELSTMDYIRGFAQNPIPDYHFSSVALVRYTHYRISLPENNSLITASGNYMLKVYLDNDTSKIAFTKRLLVVENIASISAQMLQPVDPGLSATAQRLQFTINSKSLPITNPFQQLHVVVMQNKRWDNAIYMGNPSFYSGSNFTYNNDEIPVFPGGNQWRYVDLQSFRYQSDRVAHADYLKNGTVIMVKPDKERSGSAYYYYADYNGKYVIETTDLVDPKWQSDYARVLFTYIPPDNIAYEGQDLYLIGEFTGYLLNDATKMVFNPGKGIYECSAFLKMGYYNYGYVTVNKETPSAPSFEITEGNHFETENDYDILVYYRPMGGRVDQLVGIASMNTLTVVR